MKHVLIIIVNYRTPDLVIDCLRSLEGGQGVRVVVTDTSMDDSSVRIAQAIRVNDWSWASVMRLDRNGGFAFGNNAAIEPALRSDVPPDYIMLLNPDTVVQPGAIDALVGFLDGHPAVGIAGARLLDEAGSPQSSAFHRFSPLGELDSGARLGALTRLLRRWSVTLPSRDEPFVCEWVTGAAMMVRREVFETVGLMDEGYFLYFEEADFCRRARRGGFEVWSVPQSRVVHLEGAATNLHASGERRKPYWYESRRRYFIKAYGVAGLIVADMLWAVGRCSLALRRLFHLGGDCSSDPACYAGDLLLGDLKALVTGRVWSIR